MVKLRKKILKRDNHTCVVCGDDLMVQVHHMQWQSDGGEDSEDNLVSLCYWCHLQEHCTSFVRNIMIKNFLMQIEQKRDDLAELYSQFIAALYGQDDQHFGLENGCLVVYRPYH